eukprot:CAMPEP_0202732124 /NCGR_PEP_ID=MMETSP1385-20130828/187496_1 /ASSEMBLY_ACC=CAM_ASM_000861 /TAXON_ID=933848 /ORGANISM="Elphidium margaritaceum" /LENGTH=654 /DNA_ID=CAMNT_0049398429 /DNA_START=63 /DNA_END=2028 /DNA_ORIENTATION=-
MDVIDVLAVILLSFNVLVLCPLFAYYLIVYRRYEQSLGASNPIIKHRNSPLIYAINILVIFINVSERIYMIAAKVWRVNLPEWSVDLFFSLTWWALILLFAIKCYHLHFLQQYNFAIADVTWRNDIDPTEHNWYISKRGTFGRVSYLMKIAILPYVICIALDMAVDVLTPRPESKVGVIVWFLLHVMPVLVAVYSFYSARLFNDIYGVRNEIRNQFLLLFASLCAYGISFVVCHVVGYSDTVERIEWLSFIVVSDGVCIAFALLSTAYPVGLIRKSMTAATDSFIDQTPAIRDAGAASSQSLLLVLAEYDSFKVFMYHLVSAFCAESLLFLTELTQVKYHYQVNNQSIVCTPKDCASTVRMQPPFHFELANVNSNAIKTSDSLSETIDFNGDQTLLSAFCAESLLFLTELTQVKYHYQVNNQGIVCTPKNSAGMVQLHQAVPSDSQTVSVTQQQPVTPVPFELNNSNTIKASNNLSATIDFNVRPNAAFNNEKTIFSYFFTENGRIKTPIYLPANLPQTIAISDKNETLYSQMKFLYGKYIKIGSEYEINISWRVRAVLIELFERDAPVSDFRMFNLLDEAALEIFMLLQSTFSCFVHSHAYDFMSTRCASPGERPVVESFNLNSPECPVIRNATSYSKVKKQYNGKLITISPQ